MDTVEDNLFFGDVGLPNATKDDDVEGAFIDFIGEDDEVDIVKIRTDKAYPIIRMSSPDEDAIKRVQDNAIRHSDILAA